MKPSLLIIGLGNPGASYERTRHNAGFRALDVLAEAFGHGPWKPLDKFRSVVCEARIVAVPVLLVKPQTFMNLSGDAVGAIVDFYTLPSTQTLVLYDDIDLPLGDVRLRSEGSAGTHNGMRSIVDRMGTAVPRLRIGIGKPQAGEDLAAWVLSIPPPDEEQILAATLQKLPAAVREFVVGEVGE